MRARDHSPRPEIFNEGRGNMSIAKAIRARDPTRLSWIEIEDSDGNVWRYVRRRFAPAGSPVHVEARGYQRDKPTLTFAPGGEASLRQDGPGLPKICVVRIRAPDAPGGAPPAWGQMDEEFEQQ